MNLYVKRRIDSAPGRQTVWQNGLKMLLPIPITHLSCLCIQMCVCMCVHIYAYICSVTQRCHLIFISKLAFFCGSTDFAPEFQAVSVHSQDNQVCLVENNISITCLHLQKDSFRELHALLLVQCHSFVWIIPAWCCYFALHISVLYTLYSFYCSF